MKPNCHRDSDNGEFAALLAACRQLEFEPHDLAQHLDARGRYDVELDREFPLLIKLFHYTSQRHTPGPTWHERLELFTPLDGPARFRMGDEEIRLEPGCMLVVDNLKLHHVVDFAGFDARVVVISFMPEYVHSLGSPSNDYTFLLPFYSQLEGRSHILRPSDTAASPVYRAMTQLLESYFKETDLQLRHIGCKAYLLEMLFHLARQFKASELLKWEFVRQQQRATQLKMLFDHIEQHSDEKLSVQKAAAMVHMSQPQFMRTFKKVAGMTLVAYVHRVRLSRAVRLLRETGLSIAEIAMQVGFSDQSYFDKRFKASFGQSPKEFRIGASISSNRKIRAF